MTHCILNDAIPNFQGIISGFKFENVWLLEPNFHADVVGYWNNLPVSHLLPKLVSVSEYMAKWGFKFFHKFREKVKLQKQKLDELVNKTDDEGLAKYFLEKEKLEELLCQEELYWKQRAKMFWLAEGDQNSNFFHAKATSRKILNYISYLIDDTGRRVDNQEDMCEIVKEYYKKVFTSESMMPRSQTTEGESIVTVEQNRGLVAELTFEEFELAIK